MEAIEAKIREELDAKLDAAIVAFNETSEFPLVASIRYKEALDILGSYPFGRI